MADISDRATIDEICKRSAAGEGVAAILESMGIDVRLGLIYLRDNHSSDLQAAKIEQLRTAPERDAAKAKE